MRTKKLTVLMIVWAISIILLGTPVVRPTYLVELSQDVLNFDFPSKEAYVRAVDIVQWVRWLYFGALTFLTFYLFQRQRSWQ
jgi:hypothetical protein